MTNDPAALRALAIVSRFAPSRAETETLLSLLVDQPEASLFTWLRTAERLGGGPLFCHHVSREPFTSRLPGPLRVEVVRRSRIYGIRSLRLRGAILRLLQVLSENGIPVIPLKGAFLATHLYPDMALRPMSDIDLLCPPEACGRVQDLLSASGYREVHAFGAQTPLHEKVFEGHHQHLPSVSDRVSRVEIHSHLFPGGAKEAVPVSGVWAASLPGSLEGIPCRSLHPRHLLLHLCVHTAAHWEKGKITLYWLCDIHETIRRFGRDLDWGTFWGELDALGQGEPVASLLRVLRHHWGTPLPFPDIGGPPPPLSSLFEASAQAKKRVLMQYRQHLLKAKTLERPSERIRYLLGFAFPSRAHMMARYTPRSRLDLFCAYGRHVGLRLGRAAEGIAVSVSDLLRGP